MASETGSTGGTCSDNRGGGSGQATPRLLFIDATRATAIVLAILGHGAITFRIDESVPLWLDYAIRGLVSAATPTFMLLFGVMLEMVSFNRLAKGQGSVMNRRLAQRSGMCYVGCLVIVLAAYLSGRMSPAQAGYAALFMDSANFGNILKFYTLAMLLAIPLLMLRRRVGIVGMILLGLSPWLLRPVMGWVSWPSETEPLGYWTALLFGYPASPNARYSLMHALTLVVVGMGLGRALRIGNERRDWRLFRRCMLGLLGVAGLMYAGLAAIGKLDDAWLGYVTWFRYTQHPLYYLFGITSVLIVMLTAFHLIPPGTAMTPRLERNTLLGRRALLSYTLSNALLCLWPYQWVPNPWLGLVMVLAMIPMTHILVSWYDGYEKGRQTTPAPGPVIARPRV